MDEWGAVYNTTASEFGHSPCNTTGNYSTIGLAPADYLVKSLPSQPVLQTNLAPCVGSLTASKRLQAVFSSVTSQIANVFPNPTSAVRKGTIRCLGKRPKLCADSSGDSIHDAGIQGRCVCCI